MSKIFEGAVERVRAELPGTFAVCAERLDRAAPRLAWNEGTSFPAASVIKLAVALEVMSAFDEGTLDEAELSTLRAEDKVIGSGVLGALTDGLRLPLADLLYLSMAISDNTAANLLIRRVGVASVNARLARLGLETTRLRGRIFVAGEDGELSPTTAAELVTLLRAVRDNERLLTLLGRTQTASTVGRGLPDERFPGVGAAGGTAAGEPPVTLAYKTGSLAGIVAEAAIVTTLGSSYAIALLSRDSGDLRPNHDNVGRVKLGELSRAVHATFVGCA